MRIENSVAFVTGANRGLGLAFAKELLGRRVKKLYAGVRNPDGVDLPDIIPVTFDVTDPAAVAAAALCCSDVTLLINNADRAGRCRCARSGGDRQRARVFGNQLLRDHSRKSGIRASPFRKWRRGDHQRAILCHLVCTANTDRLCGHEIRCVELHKRIAH